MYETVDHDSWIELLVEDVNPEALFSESLLGLSDVLSDASGGTAVTHEVQVTAPDLEGLLAAWVGELVRLAETDGFVPERVFRERLASSSFRARIAGEREIPQGEIRPLACGGVDLRRLDDGAWAVQFRLDVTEA